MPFLDSSCPKCFKPATIVGEFKIKGADLPLLNLECGHLVYSDQLIGGKSAASLMSLDHKRLMKFQVEGVQFIENSRTTIPPDVVRDPNGNEAAPLTGVRALITDEMGLGKTVQALGWIALQDKASIGRVLYVVKSSLKIQWLREIMRWVDEDCMVQVIEASKDHFLPCDGYIIPFDLLPRIKDLDQKLAKLKVKTMIIDECQQIKNEEANRAQVCRILARQMSNVILLSGTPIKNNAGEYFCALNIVRPDKYKNPSLFRMHTCDSYHTGYGWKTGGLRDPDEFQRETKSYIIRRTREEVMPDLPKVFRKFQFDELGKEVEQAYIEAFVEFRDDYNRTGGGKSENRLALLSRMRHLTGISKVRPCVNFVEEFLEDRPGAPITIFFHHQDVGQLLELKLNRVLNKIAEESGEVAKTCLMLTSDLNSEQRQKVIDDFRAGKSPILLASTLASAEGLNLQFCDEFIMLERQWNPANEEQAEGRFPRIGSISSSISGTYFVAIGTVDEFFAEIVEQKRTIVASTLDNKEVPWDESSIMKELTERLAAKGGQKWRL